MVQTDHQLELKNNCKKTLFPPVDKIFEVLSDNLLTFFNNKISLLEILKPN
jgi:hypothetical protein